MVNNTSVASPHSGRPSDESGISPGWFSQLSPPPRPPSLAQGEISTPPSLLGTPQRIRFSGQAEPPDGTTIRHFRRQRPRPDWLGGDDGLADAVAPRSDGRLPGRAQSQKKADAMPLPKDCSGHVLRVTDDRGKCLESCGPAEAPNRWMNSGPPGSSGTGLHLNSAGTQTSNPQASGIVRAPWRWEPKTDARPAIRQRLPLAAPPIWKLPSPATIRLGAPGVRLRHPRPSADICSGAEEVLYIVQKSSRRINRGLLAEESTACLTWGESSDRVAAFFGRIAVRSHPFPSSRPLTPERRERRAAGSGQRNMLPANPAPVCVGKNAAIPLLPGGVGRSESGGNLHLFWASTVSGRCPAAPPPCGCRTDANALGNAIRRRRAASRGREHV
jgi:hypothetical protein